MLVDFREKHSLVPELLEKSGVEFKFANLWADYVIGEVVIERKTIDDFISSITDKRLFKQADFLVWRAKSPLILLEGGGLYKTNRVPENIIRGTMLWLTMIKGIPLIRTSNEVDTAKTISLLFVKHYGQGTTSERRLKSRNNKKVFSKWNNELNILKQVPGFGLENAKKVLGKFGSVANIVLTTEEELMEIKGLGKEKASQIKKIFY